MNLDYLAFFLIAFVPLLLAVLWFKENSPIAPLTDYRPANRARIGLPKLVFAFVLSVGFVYGYINLVIHQLGFYELFFTDIMFGDENAKTIVGNFLAEYGDKHRHFGHGVLHGVINCFLLPLPFLVLNVVVENRSRSYFMHHFSYWLITSALTGGLIGAFV